MAVAGAPRSGKSLAARLLELAGVGFGPRDRLVAHLHEHAGLVAISDELLARQGARWYRPPRAGTRDDRPRRAGARGDRPRRAGAPDDRPPPDADLARQATRIVARDLATGHLWGWKDPRVTLTLAFWQRAVPELRVVVCVRHPEAVARDLQRRDDLPPEAGLALWAAYTRAGLPAQAGPPTHLLVYEDVLAEPEAVATGLATFAGAPAASLPAGYRATVERLVRPRRRAQRRGDLDVPVGAAHRDTWALAVDAYAGLRHAARAAPSQAARSPAAAPQPPPSPAVPGAVGAALDTVVSELTPALAEARPTPPDTRDRLALAELAEVVPPGERVVLVDDGAWTGRVRGPVPVPLLERDGHDAGPPADEAAALEALHARRRHGIRYLAVGWPAFWWLPAYPELFAHLRREGRCVRADGRVVVFELGPPTAPPSPRLSP